MTRILVADFRYLCYNIKEDIAKPDLCYNMMKGDDSVEMGKSLNGKELGAGISQRKDGRYVGRFTSKLGKRWCYYGNTVSEVRKLMREAQYEDERDERDVNTAQQHKDVEDENPDKDIVLDDWYIKYKTLYKSHCRSTSIDRYDMIYNRLKQQLGQTRVADIKVYDIQRVINGIKSDKSKVDCKNLMSGIMERAVVDGIIRLNPVYKVIVPRDVEPDERVILTAEQEKLFFETFRAMHNEYYSLYPLMRVAINTGMRSGELYALEWRDVDFDKNIIKVNKTMLYRSVNQRDGRDAYEVHKTKTKSGARIIPMMPVVKEVLIEWRKKSVGVIRNQYDLVFPNKLGKPFNKSAVKVSLDDCIRKIRESNPESNFPQFTMHCFRHTFATNCIDAGMNPKTLQKILGHKNISITMDLYCHVRNEKLYEEMELVSNWCQNRF